MDVYHCLLQAYGEQHWWPADTPFEMMVGSILTQNTHWHQVEKSIARLKEAGRLSVDGIYTCELDELQALIRPSGFFRQKSLCLMKFSRFYRDHGEMIGLKRWPMRSLRCRLLDVDGIGPETADSMLLYALDHPVFVVDAYARRIFHRLGLLPLDVTDYHEVQSFIHQRVGLSVPLMQEFHALIVHQAKLHCSKKAACIDCPLQPHCISAA